MKNAIANIKIKESNYLLVLSSAASPYTSGTICIKASPISAPHAKE